MKVFKPALVTWVLALAFLFSFSPQVLFAQPKYSISTESFPQQGTKQGQCVDLVRMLRPDVDTTAAPTDSESMAAFTMFENAKQKGILQTDPKVPRVGAVMVWDRTDGCPTGHVGIVKEIKSTKEGKMELVVADSNWSKPPDGKYRERRVIFDTNSSTVNEWKILGFIYESKEIYELKKRQALADLSKKAIKASKEAEKSIFRRTIEGLPEAAKNVFSILTANAPTTTFYDASENAITVAQDQTTEGVDNNPTFTSGGNYWGHIALMLTKSGALEDVYSTLGPTNLASSNISLPAYNSSRDMTMNGTSSPPQITALETSTGAVTVGIPVSIGMYELGNNSYATWGYWLQNSIMQAGGANYSVDNRGYYLTGDPTTNAQMTNLMAHNNSGTYNGTANGTYWTNAGGTNMSGTFNANVNFASRSLSNINISISGGGHSASISGATATSSGSSSTFIGNSDGQWKIDGATLGSSSSKDLRGVVLGPTGKAVGGGFGMGQTVDTTGVVIGIFQGTR
ncbi:MAG: CHAP domain-containing protein [Deltaproteobacteria bacterium]|nr:CHAP domain-containing protein [Deltaproteobacteria bacterium]MBL7196399.1 CHAP domain-containing protein [Desulfobacterales bacterium]